jgi:hypothetical protein
VDDTGRPVEVPQILPELENNVLKQPGRKQLSLVLPENEPSRCNGIESFVH